MNTIKSFLINHDNHPEGIYLSHVENNIYTYDLRFKQPNQGDYLSTASAHTIEHIFATVIRNGQIKDKVLYFGPMGCRTGFYLLLLGVDYDEAKNEIIRVLKECLNVNEIPGSKRQECGNYLDHDLQGAKKEIEIFLAKIES